MDLSQGDGETQVWDGQDGFSMFPLVHHFQKDASLWEQLLLALLHTHSHAVGVHVSDQVPQAQGQTVPVLFLQGYGEGEAQSCPAQLLLFRGGRLAGWAEGEGACFPVLLLLAITPLERAWQAPRQALRGTERLMSPQSTI